MKITAEVLDTLDSNVIKHLFVFELSHHVFQDLVPLGKSSQVLRK